MRAAVTSTKKNVLFVVRWPVGGIRTYLKYLLTNFPRSKYQIYLVAADTEGVTSLKKDVGHAITGCWLFPTNGSEVRTCLTYVNVALKSKKFDLVHAHGFTSMIASIVPANLRSIPVIFTSHDVLLRNQFQGFEGVLKRYFLKLALNRCEIINSVSFDAEDNLFSFLKGLNRSKSVVTRNGLDFKPFVNAVPLDLKGEIGIDDGNVLIGFFGRFMKQKGFSVLAEAMSILRDSRSDKNFHVVCFGSGEFIREEKENISRKGLASLFTFMPFRSDVSGAMKGCDLIVMPSLWEACPLQPMEALCAGVPFVGSNCVGLREVLDKTPAIQVLTGDAVSLAEGILRSLEMGREPFEKFAPVAAERFDVRRTAVEVYELYEKVIG